MFYENDSLPVKHSIYSQYDSQTIDVIIIDDTKSKRRSGGRPSIKGVLGLNLELGEKYLLYLGTGKGWAETLTQIKNNYKLSDEVCAVCDGDEKLHLSLEAYGYKIQQCTNHFVKTSVYYLWMEQYPKHD